MGPDITVARASKGKVRAFGRVRDVACERQVELRGPDAARLMQMLMPRDLRRMLPGQCFCVPIVDETGDMLNDPVAVKLAEDRWWISIADSDLLYRVKGIAQGWRLDVLVDEPDVSPLAVQGRRRRRWWPVLAGGERAGRISPAAASPDFGTNVAIGMIRMTHRDAGTEVEVDSGAGLRKAVVRDKFRI